MADDRCVVPAELRTRTFDVTIARQPGPDTLAAPRFDVTLRDASMVSGFNRFVIGVAGDYLAAEIGDFGHTGAGLVERLGATTYLTLAGSLSATVADTSMISASMNGAVGRCELGGEWRTGYECQGLLMSPSLQCASENHRLLLRRR